MSSSNEGKDEAIKWIKETFNQGAACLDVGAGDGKWSDLLRDYLTMDAVEAFAPNVTNNHLYNKYRNTFIADIRAFKYKYYDLIIFGDVLEHMSTEDARRVIEYARPRCSYMLVAVPYKWPQGAIYGNPYEVHIQDDLTPEIFNERYPGFICIYQSYNYAYYISGGGQNSEGDT